jgi:integrase
MGRSSGFMLDSPVRARDVLGMDLPDVDPRAGKAIVRRGKGKRRLVWTATGSAIGRHPRTRDAETSALGAET